MKLKILIAIILIPLSAFAARTNDFDYLKVNNNVGVGGKVSVAPGNTLVPLGFVHVASTNVTSDIDFLADVYGAGNIPQFVGRRARGTMGAPSAVQADDLIAAFNARGFGTTIFSAASKASIGMHASENWTDTANGTYIRFSTTTNGTTTLKEAMRIDNLGNVGIGTTSPTSTLNVIGTSTVSGVATFSNTVVVTDLGSLRVGNTGGSGTNITRSVSGVDLRDVVNPGVGGTYFITLFGQPEFTLGNASVILGANASTVLTVNGVTESRPNGWNINAGQLFAGPSGAISNSTGFITTSNIYAGPLGVVPNAPFVFIQTNQVAGQTTISTYNYGPANISQQTQSRAKGTIAAPTALILNDTLGGYSGRGHNGTAFTADVAAFAWKAAQNWAGTSNGVYGAIFLTKTNQSAIIETTRFTADRGGSMGIATNTPDSALHVGVGTGASGSGIGHLDGGLIVGATGSGVLCTIIGSTNFSWTPGLVGAVSTAVTNMSVAGVTKTSTITGNHDIFTSGLEWQYFCTNDGVVTVAIDNITAIGVTPAIHTNQIRFVKP